MITDQARLQDPLANIRRLVAEVAIQRGAGRTRGRVPHRARHTWPHDQRADAKNGAGGRTHRVYLRDCRVPAEAIIGAIPGQGFATVMTCLNKQSINLAALSTGSAIRLLNEGIAYARERQRGGRAIAECRYRGGPRADLGDGAQARPRRGC